MKKLFLVFLMILFMACGNVFALSFDSNWKEITVFDGYGVIGENDETEPGTINNQTWDLEGMFLSGNSLIIMGGFDFLTGNDGVSIGDLYFGSANEFKTGTQSIVETVFSFDRKTNNNLNSNGNITGYDYNGNGTGGNWSNSSYQYNKDLYIGGYGLLNGYNGLYTAGSMNGVGDGDTHYFIEITGIDWINFIGDFAHIGMTCNNDQLRGQVAPVPEPTTVLLSGLGLLGMGMFLRKKMFVKGIM